MEKIARIHVSCWAEVYDFMPEAVHKARSIEFRLQQWASVLEREDEQERLFAVCEHNGEVEGFGFVQPSFDDDISALGELTAGYLRRSLRGTVAGPLLMRNMILFLESSGLWPACLWAFEENRYRRFYTALGWVPTIYRDRIIDEHRLPEIGYMSPPYLELLSRLDVMIFRGYEPREDQQPSQPRRPSQRR